MEEASTGATGTSFSTRRGRRRTALPLLVSCALAFSALLATPHADAQAERPNVVLFLVDDMGWMDSSPYGSHYYETPQMERFAREGMRFTNAYAVPLCSPTRASILTGQYSARHGVTSASGHRPAAPEDASRYPESGPPQQRLLYAESRNHLPSGTATLAERLLAAGYRTGHFGKWHLGIAPEHRPERYGFETAFYAVPDPGPPSYFSPYGVVPDGLPLGRTKVGSLTDGPDGEYVTDRLTDEAIAFMRAHRDEPFFLYLPHYAVHGPWGHKEEYTREFAGKKDPRGLQGNPIMASMFRSVDESLGRVLDALEELGLEENTLFLFFSDNGGNVHSNTPGSRQMNVSDPGHPRYPMVRDWLRWAGELPPTNNAPLREGKGRIYEGGQRVPFMARWPGRIPGGSVSDEIVSVVDLFPTILAAAGTEAPEGQAVDGLSLLPHLEEGSPLGREAVFTWFPHLIPAVSVRAGPWKLIRRWEPHRDYPELLELYHLEDDLGETTNLAAEHPEKVAELGALIDGFIEDTGALEPIPNPNYREAGAPASPGPARGKVKGKGNGKAAASPAAADPLSGLVPRGVEAAIEGGALRIEGGRGAPFLGTARLSRLAGPLGVRLLLRGGAGESRVEWRLPGQEDFPGAAGGQAIPYEATGEVSAETGWEEIALALPVEGAIGTTRIHLPVVAGGTIEIGLIEFTDSDGKQVSWDFRE